MVCLLQKALLCFTALANFQVLESFLVLLPQRPLILCVFMYVIDVPIRDFYSLHFNYLQVSTLTINCTKSSLMRWV